MHRQPNMRLKNLIIFLLSHIDFTTKAENKNEISTEVKISFLVAGAGFEPTTSGL